MTTVTNLEDAIAPTGQGPATHYVVPSSVHSIAAAIAGSGSTSSAVIPSAGFTGIAAAVTSSQAGTLAIQRYLDTAGTIVQGAALSVNLLAATPNVVNVLADGLPFQSYVVTITNSSGSTANLTGVFVLMQAGGAGSEVPATTVDVSASALPTGAATAALQSVTNTLLSGYTGYNYVANTVGTAVKASAGVLGGISINTAGVTSTATLYEGTSTGGTKLATISTTAQGSLSYGIAFSTGLFMVLTGAAPADITVMVR